MQDNEVVVGAFRLLEQIGRGGMGVVWRAEHVSQDVQAAVKFITSRHSKDDKYRGQFRNEVQAMASLHHPHIAMVFDYGVTGRVADFGVEDHSPYLAMEWAPAGTLADQVPLGDWATIRDCVLEILDGLAHAHARGVVHRDLKPHNVLFDVDGRAKLADFGLAYRRGPGAADSIGGTSGTPRWMAPEQIGGNLRDQGPWTDLYALGCIIFWLLTYRPPYWEGETEDILRGHLGEPIPRLESRIAVPEEIESWLRRLLAKDPHDRYRYAADAAHDLLELRAGDSLTVDPDDQDFHQADTVVDPAGETQLVDEPPGLEEPSSYGIHETSTTPVRLHNRPPPPHSWSRPQAPLWPMRLIGAGLGLWGLRPIPMVDRLHERDTLWGRLREVHVNERPHVAVLRGAAGTGKSRLARWLAERSVELGATHPAYAVHSPTGARGEGLAAMARDHFRAHDLDSATILRRVRDEFEALQHPDDRFDTMTLAELIEQATGLSHETAAPAADARENWWNAWIRYLSTLTTDRPALLWFDDVQWGAGSLGFVEHLLQTDAPPRVLVVLTVRDEALVERPVESRRLARLLEREEVSSYRVEPLDPADQMELVSRLLRLTPELAREVTDRTAGNPLFAVQLVDDWVQRGLLVVGEQGFELAAEATAELPEGLRTVWTSRIERFVASQDQPEKARHALEVAATIGQEIDVSEWRAICTELGVEIPRGLEHRLRREGLATGRPQGWAFCHGMLREALTAQASEGGRFSRWNSGCADFLLEVDGLNRENAERIANYLISADRLEEALQPLLSAAEAHARRGDADRVDATFEHYDALLDELGHGTTVERVTGMIQQARTAMFRVELDEVDRLLNEAEEAAATLDDPTLNADVLFVRSRYFRHRGQCAEAIPLAEEALELFLKEGADVEAARVRRALGELYRRTGKFTASQESYEKARELFEAAGDEFQVGWCESGLAATAKQHGDHASHRRHIETAIEAFERTRSYEALGSALNEKAEGLRIRGDLEAAAQTYEKALRCLPEKNSNAGVIMFNLGVTSLQLERWNVARDWLRRGQANFLEFGRTGPLVFIETGMLVCAAAAGRWDEWESHRESVAPRLEQLFDSDIARMLSQCGDLCEEAGEHERAVEMWKLACDHWEKLEQPAMADQVRAKLQQ